MSVNQLVPTIHLFLHHRFPPPPSVSATVLLIVPKPCSELGSLFNLMKHPVISVFSASSKVVLLTTSLPLSLALFFGRSLLRWLSLSLALTTYLVYQADSDCLLVPVYILIFCCVPFCLLSPCQHFSVPWSIQAQCFAALRGTVLTMPSFHTLSSA